MNMQTYSCFFLADDGRISDILFLECADDGAALKRADGLLRHNPVYRQVEIWQADRKIYGAIASRAARPSERLA